MANPEAGAPRPERVWALKPWWCQPWSILVSGVALAGGSWWLLHRIWLTGLVSLAVILWWWLFLVLMPAQWRHWQEQQSSGAFNGPESPSMAGEASAGASAGQGDGRSPQTPL
ncbi:MAG: DUF6737 family protein [Synechococcaceae cyanobacterium]|nr:DUF6737 family protein [Synechococcaceae cyanobacterium]